MHREILSILAIMLSVAVAAPSALAESPLSGARILFLSKSEAFEHSVIAQKDGNPSHCDTVMKPLLEEKGATYTSTKDASLINADNLGNYDIVIFYTQGDISKPGKDGAPGIGPNGETELLAWIEKGGLFMGYHAASDTFHTPKDGDVSPFLKMAGGEFAGHGAQFRGTVKVVDPSHPAMASIPEEWTIREEWYKFRNLNEKTMRVLALLDPGKEREKQKMYNVPSYPMIWCSAYGDGRVYFNGIGHREDVWTSDVFKASIIDAAEWLLDKDNAKPKQTKPNYSNVVPKK